MKELVWLHEDALRLTHPVLDGGDGMAVFVWDEDYFLRMGYGFQRLVFIYETLCEMGVQVYRGETVETLVGLLEQYSLESLRVPFSPNPELGEIVVALEKKGVGVEVVPDQPFAHLRKEPDLKRFFRYWNKARKTAMLVDGGVDAS